MGEKIDHQRQWLHQTNSDNSFPYNAINHLLSQYYSHCVIVTLISRSFVLDYASFLCLLFLFFKTGAWKTCAEQCKFHGLMMYKAGPFWYFQLKCPSSFTIMHMLLWCPEIHRLIEIENPNNVIYSFYSTWMHQKSKRGSSQSYACGALGGWLPLSFLYGMLPCIKNIVHNI